MSEEKLLKKIRDLREDNRRLKVQLAERDGTALSEARQRSARLEKTEGLFLNRWQRVLKAYLSLREVKALRDDEPHAPKLARYIALHRGLEKGDLKVMP